MALQPDTRPGIRPGILPAAPSRPADDAGGGPVDDVGVDGVAVDDVAVDDIAQAIWAARYRALPGEASIEASWRRVARAVATAERGERGEWAARFFDILQDCLFLPGGRILAGAGAAAPGARSAGARSPGQAPSLFNCFVMEPPREQIAAICRQLGEAMATMQGGGGIGCDVSAVLPAEAAGSHDGLACGPVPVIGLFDAACAAVGASPARRGAMMATLRDDHPDVFAFIDAKRAPGRFVHANLSVLVSDALMRAVAQDEPWPLLFPAHRLSRRDRGEGGAILRRDWTGESGKVPCQVVRMVEARALWRAIAEAACATGDPGVLFVDRINRDNNLHYCERITATNPCGEVPLPPDGGCDLGSINLARMVEAPFTRRARLDIARIGRITRLAVRFLDDVIEVGRVPLPRQRRAIRETRRIGLGITGLADALVMLGLDYDSDAARAAAAGAMRAICHEAYRESIALAREKGAFPGFRRDGYLAGRFIAALPADIRDGIARHGIRNAHLLAIAPAGSISLLAGNVSTGIEPVFAAATTRRIADAEGRILPHVVADQAVAAWRRLHATGSGLPPALRTATDLPVGAHLAMQAALQPYVDNAIAKTVNLPAAAGVAEVASILDQAWALGLKGCTVFRAGGRAALGPACCAPAC